MIFFSKELVQFRFAGMLKILFGQKGVLQYAPVGSIMRSAELHSSSAEKLHDQECPVTLFRQGGYAPLRRQQV